MERLPIFSEPDSKARVITNQNNKTGWSVVGGKKEESSLSFVQRYNLTPRHTIARVIKGGWQLTSGDGPVDQERALEDMRLYVEAGITTFDCADIYTGVEELIGQFLRRYRGAMEDGSLPKVQIHTKCVPDLHSLPALRRKDIEAIVDRSLQRLGVDQLDLVQFHWWDYTIPGYVEAASHLQALQKAGKIKELGVTNFDVAHLEEILEAGIDIVSNQVQYSVLDHRPERGMVSLCQQRGLTLLCYGTVAGGLLSARYLGVPEPQPPYKNRSVAKYKLIVDDFGSWDLFQQLLTTLQELGQKHGVSIAAVASRYILQKNGVGAVIIGARHARHLPETVGLFGFGLDEQDLEKIDGIVQQSLGPAGDIYSVERVKGQRHAVIMNYDLNRQGRSR